MQSMVRAFTVPDFPHSFDGLNLGRRNVIGSSTMRTAVAVAEPSRDRDHLLPQSSKIRSRSRAGAGAGLEQESRREGAGHCLSIARMLVALLVLLVAKFSWRRLYVVFPFPSCTCGFFLPCLIGLGMNHRIRCALPSHEVRRRRSESPKCQLDEFGQTPF